MADDAQRTPDSMWQEVMRIDAPPVTDPYMEATTEQLFGGLWARPGFARRDRRLTTLTVIATRGLREPLIGHLSAALSSGDITAEELHEWVLHVAFYAGWPAGANAYAALHEVLAHPTSAG
jgi:4-carboxymuconolactone decarboxylase